MSRRFRRRFSQAAVVAALVGAAGLPDSSNGQDITSNLRGLWALNETSGTSAADSSGNSANGTYSGSPDLGNSGRFSLSSGFSGNGGTTDRLSLPNTVLNGQTSLTLSFWLKTSSTAYHSIISAANASEDNEYFVFIEAAGTLKVRFKGVSNSSSWDVSATRDGKWRHFAIVTNYSAGTTSVYVDGVLISSQSVAPSGSLSVSSGGLFLGQDQDSLGGGWDSTQRLIGDLDQVRIYGRALSALDVKNLYGEGEPIVHWRLDETSGTTAADSSGIGLAGAVSGAASWISGRRRNGLDCNGSTKVEATTLAGQPTDFTLACWVRLDAADTSGAEAISVGDYLILRAHEPGAASVRGSFYSGSSTYVHVAGSQNYVGSGWRHFAVTFDDAANSLKIYVDGVLVATTSTTSSVSWSGLGTKVVAGAHGNASTAYDLDGGLDDVRVYNRALSALQVLKLYGLVGRWKLDESSGLTAADASGSGASGTHTNGPLVNQTGAYDAAASYDGVDDYTAAAANTQLETTEDATISAWVKPVASSNAVRMILNKEGEYEIALDNLNRVMWAISNSSPGWAWHTTTATVKNGRWSHILVAYDGSAVKTYVNGTLQESYAASGAMSDSHAALDELRLGGRSNNPANQYFSGVIDEVRVYNRAVNAEEAAELCGVLGHWKFNETSGSTAADSSAQANQATFFTGSPTWVSGVRDNGLQFDGTNDAVTANSFKPPTEGTVAFWYRCNGPNGIQRLFGLGGDWETRLYADGLLYFDINADSPGGAASMNTLTPVSTSGQWYHAAFVFDSDDDSYAIYLNGALHKSGVSGTNLTQQAAAKLSFGTRTGATERLNGALDDVLILNRKLSQAEVYDLYGLQAWYKLDELSGSTAADSTGLGNDGAYSGSPTLGVTANGAASQGTAIELNGSNYVEIPGLFDKTGSVSAAAWVRFDASDSGGGELFSIGNCFALRLISGSPGAVAWYFNGTTWIGMNLPDFTLHSGWHHLAMVLREGDALKIYLDGNEAASQPAPQAIAYAGAGTNTFIGRHGNGETTYDLTGRVDDVKFFNRAMTPDEVYSHYRGSRVGGVRILNWLESR